ncbi:wall-associated receptor kinase-like 8 [Quercus suber]|uniref:wall-associated receptor kinase-like 8 n=1 Tax=Quercus suber TaxID=58331 RepID=UPI0032DFCA20
MAVKFVMRITFLLLLAVAYGLAEGAPPMAKPNCPDRCGNVSIPYPFGIGSNCFMNKTYEIVCNESGVAAAAIAFLVFPSIRVEVLEIRITDPYNNNDDSFYGPGFIRVKMPIISSNCINKSSAGSVARVNISGTPFFFSSYRNKFVSVGCDNLATMTGLNPMMVVGCKTNCSNKKLIGKCSGFDCCQTSVPDGIQLLNVTFSHTSSCQRAFLAETQWLEKTDPSASNHFLNSDYVPVMLEWIVKFTDYDFEELYYRRHMDWYNTTYGVLYPYCSYGFQGNPYLNMGCQDINECEDEKRCPPDLECENTEGSSNCKKRKSPLMIPILGYAMACIRFMTLRGTVQLTSSVTLRCL